MQDITRMFGWIALTNGSQSTDPFAVAYPAIRVRVRMIMCDEHERDEWIVERVQL